MIRFMSQSTPPKNRMPVLLIVFALAGLGTWLLWSKYQTTPVQNVPTPITPIPQNVVHQAASVPVAASSAEAKTVFSCMIEPEQTVEIRSSVTGVIDKIMVKRGDIVKKGQILVVLDADVAQSAVDSARSRAQAQAQIEGAHKKLALAEIKAKRMENMYREDFVSAQARDDALNEKNIAAAELKQAQENHQIAQADYRTSLAELKERTITSPFNGIVTARYADIGTVVSATDSKNPILRLAQTNRLKLTAVLPFKHFRDIQVGDIVQVIPEIPFDQAFNVTVAKKDQVIDASSGTFSIIAYINNLEKKLPAGILCQVDIR
ncbi:efflux RND transporter periplasmic adaptor subunit [Conchiformibius steedae]|uniref:Efflux RND transporter periplasmic adaptor subunit n=2 Tax=Conchiformibius steedae TaxID=153493 RepID=A0A3P2A1T4_9NEIS|nr:efflux RND transporter periplasmic adaptor subunit [Conchiformibius steedae]